MFEFFTNITPLGITAQLIGFCGTACFFISYQQRDKSRILTWQIIAISFFTVHFFMLGAYTGGMMNLFGVMRAFVFSRPEKWAKSKLWFWFFMVLYTCIGIFTWAGIESIFPLVAMLLSTYGFTKKEPGVFRKYMFPCSPLWFVYNVMTGSVSGCITECFTMTSLIIAFVRYDIKKKSPAQCDKVTENNKK